MAGLGGAAESFEHSGLDLSQVARPSARPQHRLYTLETVPVAERLEQIHVCGSAQEVGRQAAEKLVQLLTTAVDANGKALLVLACAPSQHETWEHLIPMLNERSELLAKLTFINMDDYVGVNEAHDQSFTGLLKRNFFAKLRPPPTEDRVVLLKGDAENPRAEASRISDVIKDFAPESIVVMGGFGTDGHLAFDDFPLTGKGLDGQIPLVTVRNIDLAARQQQVTDGCFGNLQEVPERCYTLTNWFFRTYARGGIVLAAKGDHKRAAADTLLLEPTEHSPVTLLYRETGATGDMPCTPHVFLDPQAGAGVEVAAATSVMTAKPCRVFGCGKLPMGLLWLGIKDGQVALTTGNANRASSQLPATLEVQGLFKGNAVQASFEIGTFHPDLCAEFAHAEQLAALDRSRDRTILLSNNQEYFEQGPDGTPVPSTFAKNLAVYLAKRFQMVPNTRLQIAPLELFRNNGERLYDAVCQALGSSDVVAHLTNDPSIVDAQAFLNSVRGFVTDTCCWYNTIDDRIVTDRLENGGKLVVKTEPYATLHCARAKQSVGKHEKLPSPFIANGDSVGEVKDLQPYISRKLGLLNAVHVCAVIEQLRERGINSFGEIRDQAHIDEALPDDAIVRQVFADRDSEAFKRINSAAQAIRAILEIAHPGGDFNFGPFLHATYDRFANPNSHHKLRDIFQGMDKFPPKITERIKYFIDIATGNPLYDTATNSEGYRQLVEYSEFINADAARS